MQPRGQLLFIPGPGFGSHEEARVLGPRLQASGWETTFWNDPPHTQRGQNAECSFDQYLDSLERDVRTAAGTHLTIACHSAAIHPMLIALQQTSVTPERIVLIAPACDLTDAFRRVLGLAASDLGASRLDASQRLKVLIGQTRLFADAAMREGLELAATDPILFTHYWRDQAALAAFAEAARFPDGQFRPDVFFTVLEGIAQFDLTASEAVDSPALAMFGTADPVINSEVSLSVARTKFPQLDVDYFDETGHWLHLEHPDACLARLTGSIAT